MDLTQIAVQRHAMSTGRCVVFGSLNVRSLSPLKLDLLLEESRDRLLLDLLPLRETWHDVDSVAIRRLRSQGFRVTECARPRSCRTETSLGVNHGGVAIVAAAGIRLNAVDVGTRRLSAENYSHPLLGVVHYTPY